MTIQKEAKIEYVDISTVATSQLVLHAISKDRADSVTPHQLYNYCTAALCGDAAARNRIAKAVHSDNPAYQYVGTLSMRQYCEMQSSAFAHMSPAARCEDLTELQSIGY